MASAQETPTSTTSTSPECAVTGDWVRLNVGGTMFETTRTTLARLNSQFLDRLLAEDSGFSPPADGVYRIDRDPDVFRVLLNFARYGCLALSPQVTSDMMLADAEFYMIRQVALKEAIEGLPKEKPRSARGQGRVYVPAEVSSQGVGTGHHNGLIFERERDDESGRYMYKGICSVVTCKTKVSKVEVYCFEQKCISCDRKCRLKHSNWAEYGEIVAAEWCHKCLRCLDCQETVCLP